MKKVYEADGKEKESILDEDNEIRAFEKSRTKNLDMKDFIMITRLKEIPKEGMVDSVWSINGITSSDDNNNSILVFEPLSNQIMNGIANIGPNNTCFKRPINLSSKAVILMPLKKYVELGLHLETRRGLRKQPILLYEGREDLAVKMLMQDRGFIRIPLNSDGYIIDEKRYPDLVKFTQMIIKGEEIINEQISEDEIVRPYSKKRREAPHKLRGESIDSQTGDYRMITGLTDDVEGEITLDDELSASTDIGKKRSNQEDAVLLIRDKKNPNFKMMVVADGMGGCSSGEVASDVIITRLKGWFENLTESERECFKNSVGGLKESLLDEIELKVQPAVEAETWEQGGSTLVCAIIGENDTLIANVGDSRAYIAKDGKLLQISREDTEAQRHLEEGIIPTKEASRFDQESNILRQSIGMDRRRLEHPYTQVIKNSDYDLLLLFTDGVTDCLSDEDIVAVCKTSDKSELARKIVEKAIRHDSVVPEEYMDYSGLNLYIPGGKDNATAAVYTPKRKEERGRED